MKQNQIKICVQDSEGTNKKYKTFVLYINLSNCDQGL